jgi:hypothetical protein
LLHWLLACITTACSHFFTCVSHCTLNSVALLHWHYYSIVSFEWYHHLPRPETLVYQFSSFDSLCGYSDTNKKLVLSCLLELSWVLVISSSFHYCKFRMIR